MSASSENLVLGTETVAVHERSTVISPALGPGFRTKIKTWATSEGAAVAIRGGTWSLIGYVVTQLLRTVATLVLARHFLGPEPFGVVGLVGVFIAGLSMFSELGILANIVQHPRGDDPRFLNTAFSIQAARGLAIFTIATLAGYPVALFYHQPQLLALLTVAALSELVRGFTSTAAFTLSRHVKLRNITLLAIASESVASGVALLWAVWSPSAWALVARSIASAGVYALGSHFIAKPQVWFAWDRTAAKEILHFGGWISISTAAYFMGGQSERLILGKFVTAAELGCFSLALMISAVPAAGISQLASQIFLPMISSTVRSSHSETVRNFLYSRWLFFGLAVFAGIGFLACGRPVVFLMLPPKYAMAGWMLQALGIRVALDVFSAPASNLLLAYGKTQYAAAGSTARLVFMIAGIWVSFAFFGLRQAVACLILAQVLSYFPLLLGIRKLLPEVALAELRWYVIFLAVVGVGAFVAWPQW